jgi:FkbM family methyltransferase
MLSRFLKQLIKQSLRSVGLDIRRLPSLGSTGHERSSLQELLRQAKQVRVSPRTIVDVGAAFGSFSQECFLVFPNSHYLLVEPLVEYQAPLTALEHSMPAARYICAAASSHSGETQINVHPDLVGSSLLREVEKGTDVNGVPRTVRAVTIDGLTEETGAAGPYLLKVDVQGAELEVLRGAEAMLRQTEYVILEVSFFRFFEGGPEFFDVITYMKSNGFVVYDIMALQYRPLDRALSQADVTFVKESGPFRNAHFYATPSQRAEQTRRIRAQLTNLLAWGR